VCFWQIGKCYISFLVRLSGMDVTTVNLKKDCFPNYPLPTKTTWTWERNLARNGKPVLTFFQLKKRFFSILRQMISFISVISNMYVGTFWARTSITIHFSREFLRGIQTWLTKQKLILQSVRDEKWKSLYAQFAVFKPSFFQSAIQFHYPQCKLGWPKVN